MGIVISTNDPETSWNAFRFGNFCLGRGDQVRIFLIGKGVEFEKISTEKFNTVDQAEKVRKGGGKIDACGTCIKAREQKESELCPISSMKELYEIVKESDRLLTF
jgi:uncharacterized protein involved in oxidation of intracellular sulfur